MVVSMNKTTDPNWSSNKSNVQVNKSPNWTQTTMSHKSGFNNANRCSKSNSTNNTNQFKGSRSLNSIQGTKAINFLEVFPLVISIQGRWVLKSVPKQPCTQKVGTSLIIYKIQVGLYTV